jgi:HPt (histidine-containing phosphotransfer) domain-containing protein
MEDSPLAKAEGLRSRPLWDTPPADIIDHKLLHDLTLGDKGLSRELLALFFDHSALALRRLREAGDQASRRAAAHALHGSALAVAAQGVAVSAAMIAGLPENVAEGDWLDAVTDLHAQVAQTRAAIAHLLAEDAA